MKLIIDIPDTQYHNIMDFKMLCLGRIPYKGIIRHSIIAIQNGTPLDNLRAEINAIELSGLIDEHTLFARSADGVKNMVLEIIDRYRNEVNE